MSALDTAKEIIRITSTAGLSKDVIDLMEKKLAILMGELSEAQRKIANLETENAKLRAQLQNLQPVGLQESMGVLWKRTADGFEPHPYCKECPTHPVMTPMHPTNLAMRHWRSSCTTFCQASIGLSLR